MTKAQVRLGLLAVACLAAGSMPAANGEMSADTVVRGCSNYDEWSPVYQPTADACYAYCAQNGADSCEWRSWTYDCYVEFGDGCHLEGGYSGWHAALLGSTPPPQNSGDMSADSAVRGCANYVEWSPVYQPDASACQTYCENNGANACEWHVSGSCYAEFGSGCYLEGGHGGWYALVMSSGNQTPTTRTFLINGSLVNPGSSWIQPGTSEFNAIASTYGAQPTPWPWQTNSLSQVVAPSYSGIVTGGFDLANFLNSLPPGDVNLIAHSHGGNVVLMSQNWLNRRIRRIVELATPVNYDFGNWRYAMAYNTVEWRCLASSTADWYQFAGASPYQMANFAVAVYQSWGATYQAFQSLLNGDYETAFWYFLQTTFDAWQADYWWRTTKEEVEGPTYWFSGLAHDDMHEPPVWNAIAPYCQ